MVHVTTPRLVEMIDMQTTAVNAITASCPEDCRIPMTLSTEKEAIAAALMTIGPYTPENVRIVHIKNTLHLNHMRVSVGVSSRPGNPSEHHPDIGSCSHGL